MNDSQSRLVVLLGMHRSSTSAIIRALELLGVGLDSNLHPAGFDNPEDFWEDRSVLEINEELLTLQGSAYDPLVLAQQMLWPNSDLSRLKLKASQLIKERLAEIKGIWGFSDPRTCRLLSFWLGVFSEAECRVSFIIALGNPANVAASIGSSNEIPAVKSYWLWLQHMLPALVQSRGFERIVVDCDLFLDAPYAQLVRISKEIDLPLPSEETAEVRKFVSEFLESGLRHQSFTLQQLKLDSRAPVPVCDLYQVLSSVARDKVALEDEVVQLQLAVLERGLIATAPLVQYTNSIQDHLSQALTERDGLIVDLSQMVAERDARIVSIGASLADREATIKEIYVSRSWQLTSPLRWIAGIIRGRRSASLVASDENRVSFDFDPDYYLRAYPDIAEAGVDPAQHFMLYGRYEGRMPKSPSIEFKGSIEAEFDPARESVLVVSHEASRSGAPILSLNLVRILKQRYNVVLLLLGDGPLVNAFRDEGAVVIGPCGILHNPSVADLILGKILGPVFSKCQFKFALANSIVSRVVLPILAKHFIPTISLLHEFAAYTRPRDAFRQALFWSGETVFSAKLTLQSALEQYPDLGQRFYPVLPQGRCYLPLEKIDEKTRAAERNKLLKALRPSLTGDEPSFLVLGAGTVEVRKGVDLFIECASRVIRSRPTKSIRFVWIGNGYDPDHDAKYSVYLADQIERAGLVDHVTFIGETAEMDVVYDAADLLLLTSRLDPLPNVAIDALSEGRPVMCFEKATGIADILVEGGLKNDCVADYLDTQELADKILHLAEDSLHYRDVAARCKQLAVSTFDMERYVLDLEKIAEVVAKQSEQEACDVAEILRSNLLDQDFCSPPHHPGQSLEETVRVYVRSWVAGIGRRKPFPGFHPGIYVERQGISAGGLEPLADYLRSGSPAGPWRLPVIRDTDECSLNIGKSRVALHLHVFYPDLLTEMLERLGRNAIRPDLFISLPTGPSVDDVARQLASYAGNVVAIETVPNRGRDIGPFLTTFGPRIAASYDFIGHLHTKKSVHIKDSAVGAVWYRFLLENLLGGESGAMMDRILGYMSRTPSIGMVFPDDPNVVGWDANKSFAASLAGRLGITELPEHFVFPVGNMFWARVDALKRFWLLDLDWNDYPDEPLPNDGSLLHALERLFPLGLEEGANQCALTNVSGMSR
jgi:glycosyltransferase involved in cell wall biosynthesis